MTICYTYAYNQDNNLYINLTNKCTNRCDFCIRNNKSGVGTGANLWISSEPSFDEVISDLEKHDYKSYDEVVFCGYGEPTMRLDVLLDVCRYIKENSNVRTRLNTNGQANLIHKEDVTPKFEGLLDTVSVSLNAKDKEAYDKICHSAFGTDAYEALLDFTKKAKRYTNCMLSIVDVMDEEDIKKCKEIADNLGVELKIRHFVEEE